MIISYCSCWLLVVGLALALALALDLGSKIPTIVINLNKMIIFVNKILIANNYSIAHLL